MMSSLAYLMMLSNLLDNVEPNLLDDVEHHLLDNVKNVFAS